MTAELDAVWQGYQRADASIGQALRLLDTDPAAPPSPIVLAGETPEEARNRLRQARDDLKHLAVLALFAVAERSVVDHLASATVNVKQKASDLEDGLVSEGMQDLDRWPADDLLDACKGVVRTSLIGDVKQVKDYRDWVAHGRRESPLPWKELKKVTRIDPESAYRRLKHFLDMLLTET